MAACFCANTVRLSACSWVYWYQWLNTRAKVPNSSTWTGRDRERVSDKRNQRGRQGRVVREKLVEGKSREHIRRGTGKHPEWEAGGKTQVKM